MDFAKYDNLKTTTAFELTPVVSAPYSIISVTYTKYDEMTGVSYSVTEQVDINQLTQQLANMETTRDVILAQIEQLTNFIADCTKASSGAFVTNAAVKTGG